MPRSKKDLPDEILIPAQEIPVRTVSRKVAKALLAGKDPNAPPRKRPERTEAQKAAWAANIQRVKDKAAAKRAEKEQAAELLAEAQRKAVEAKEKVVVKVRKARDTLPKKPAPIAAPVAFQATRKSKPEPQQTYEEIPSDPSDNEELTELDTDLASEVEVKPKVPRRVKMTVKAVKEIDKTIQKLNSGQAGYDALLAKHFL